MSFADQTGTTEPQATPEDQTTQTQPFMVVGERAFSSQEDVVTKIQHADNHIKNIEQQNAAYLQQIEDLQRKVAESSKIDDVLAKVTPQSDQPSTTQQPTVSASPEDVVNQVLNALDTRNQAKTAKQNQDEMVALASEHYGSTYQTSVEKIAGELGMNMQDVDKLAGDNPKVFKQLFIKGAKVTSQDVSFTGSDVNSAVGNTQAQQKRVSLLDMPKSKDRAAAIQARMAQYMQNQ